MRKRPIILGISLAAALSLPLLHAVSAVQQPASRSATATVRVSVEPYLSVDGCGGIITPCQAWVFVPPPCDGKLKTVVNTFTVNHNERLSVTAWRCGDAGSNRPAPVSANGTTYKIEFFAEGTTVPFYTYGPAPLPSLSPVSLTSVLPGQSHGSIQVRITRSGKTARSLEGDWLALMFARW